VNPHLFDKKQIVFIAKKNALVVVALVKDMVQVVIFEVHRFVFVGY